MSDRYTRLIAVSQTLERLLERRFNATGRGLHEKLSSVAGKIPPNVQKKIRFIATIRNKATHEDVGIARENFSAVQAAYREILPFLDGGAARRRAAIRRLLFAIGAVVAAAIGLAIVRRSRRS